MSKQDIRCGQEPVSAAHPAIQAWRRLGVGRAVPQGIVSLDAQASSVYRIKGVGPGGSCVIAKRSSRHNAAVERVIYERILPKILVSRLNYYGFVQDDADTSSWLFLEDAAGGRYWPNDRHHRELAGTWLGRLHSVGTTLARRDDLPVCKPEPHLSYLASSYEMISQGLDNPAIAKSDREVLQDLLVQLGVLKSRWAQVNDLCERLPRVLIHGDFLHHNMQVRHGANDTVLLPFDWGLAGWGLPVTDLAQSPLPSHSFSANADVTAYWSQVRGVWPDLSLADWLRAANYATVFQSLSAIYRDAPFLKEVWPQRTMNNMRYYGATLAHIVKEAGWYRFGV